ncbi:MAG: 7TM diverse intracellular signaling domain-containing protein, partial [Pseudomonadota bacterium]|nr:7TM diverse intracellular signaling domain-containing protein [Pseudomonadota bacterium]
MMRSVAFVITLGLSVWACAKHSSAVDISQSTRESIGTSLVIIEENGDPLTLTEVRQRYEQHAYDVHTNDVLSRGINAPAIWLITELHNPTLFPLSKRLVVDTTWLDQLDIYIAHAQAPTAHHRLGDNLPFEQRPINSRHFALDYDFGPGTTWVYLRVDTPDPMTLPIYLMDIDDYIGQERRDGYLHGFIYGVVIALMLYNLILAVRLLNPINLYYSVFMLAFLAMNLAYTGHGYAWLWGDYPNIQRWTAPFFMGCYMVWGLFFGVRFLNLKQHIPWLHRSILFSIAVIASSLLLLIAIGAQGLTIHFAFAYMMTFAAGTLVLGAIATSRKLPSANYFLAATLLGVTGALITTLTVWGIISYHPIGYLAVDIGMALEAVLLSLALAHQFNQIKNEKLQAERLAR